MWQNIHSASINCFIECNWRLKMVDLMDIRGMEQRATAPCSGVNLFKHLENDVSAKKLRKQIDRE